MSSQSASPSAFKPQDILSGLSKVPSVPLCLGFTSRIAKTIYLLKLQQEVTNQTVVYLNAKEFLEHTTVEGFLKELCEQGELSGNEATLDLIIDSNGDGLVLLVDNVDPEVFRDEFSVLGNVLKQKLLPKCSVIVGCYHDDLKSITGSLGSRCANTKLEHEKRIEVDEQTELLELLRTRFKSDRMADYIKSNCIELCSNLEILKFLLKEFNKRLPQTLSTMMETLVLNLMKSGVEAKSLSTLTGRAQTKFLLLCRLAYILLKNNQQKCSFDDVSRCLMLDTSVGVFSSMENIGLGLIEHEDEEGLGSYKFLHQTIQKFLAAYYIANEPLFRQVHIFRKTGLLSHPEYDQLCRFYFGMGPILSSSEPDSKSVTTYAQNPLLGTIDLATKDVDSTDNRNKICLVYQLLHECQDKDLVRKYFSKRQNSLSLSLGTSELSESLMTILSYIITNSGVPKWTIHTPSYTMHSAEFISLLVKKDSACKVNVGVIQTKKERFVVQPAMSSSENIKPYSSVCLFVRCMRELLHRVLQMYSPIKLKSDSSDPSSISFLACECLKRRFEKEQLLLFEPIQALHWLKVPVKGKVQEHGIASSSRMARELQELHQHMLEHDMEHLELVIMMTPLPNRVYYVDPSTNKRRCINLFEGESQVLHRTSITESLGSVYLECNPIEESDARDKSGPGLSELVTLPLPLPKSDKEAFDSIVFNHSFTHRRVESSSLVKGHSQKGEMEQSKIDKSDQDHVKSPDKVGVSKPSEDFEILSHVRKSSEEFEILSREVVASHSQGVQESVQNVSQFQKQVAVEPGTILYTTIPHIFTMDLVYGCPDESRLIKRGGNGAIYAAFYGSQEFAIKKTPYRSREIQIHKMLKHPNIVELVCLMFGKQQPEHKRRYFSYHFMPKLSGDLSRMVTNKPELTMVNLSRKYVDSPRILGSMQGNWKYILKEVLKGLGHMHSMNVIHRDMKASNILIKMFCNCDNPLTCICQEKFSVHIADFDAAVELSAQGSLHPTPLQYRQPSHTSYGEVLFQIVPVGTDGYRAPESAQTVLSNDLSLLDPALTVKADIWSLGLILMRMLNGANGPTRQQKVRIYIYM